MFGQNQRYKETLQSPLSAYFHPSQLNMNKIKDWLKKLKLKPTQKRVERNTTDNRQGDSLSASQARSPSFSINERDVPTQGHRAASSSSYVEVPRRASFAYGEESGKSYFNTMKHGHERTFCDNIFHCVYDILM